MTVVKREPPFLGPFWDRNELPGVPDTIHHIA